MTPPSDTSAPLAEAPAVPPAELSPEQAAQALFQGIGDTLAKFSSFNEEILAVLHTIDNRLAKLEPQEQENPATA